MTRILQLACLLASLVFAPGVVLAEEIGKIKVLSGQVSIEREGKRIEAVLGAAVHRGDKVVTGPDGSAGILLDDDSRLSLGPNSRVSLAKFEFNLTSHDGDAEVAINKGTLSVIAGKLTRKNPKALRVRTPAAILAVRGTEFSVQIVDEVVDQARE